MPKKVFRPATPLALTPRDLRELLPISKRGSYMLAQEIGRRVGAAYIIPRVAFERWLDGEKASAAPQPRAG